MKRGEIWWVCFDPALGSEIQKTRPAVIVSNNSANQYLARVVVVPLTSNVSRVYPGECIVDAGPKKGKAMCDQIQAVDKQRLLNQMGTLNEEDLLSLEGALKLHLALE